MGTPARRPAPPSVQLSSLLGQQAETPAASIFAGSPTVTPIRECTPTPYSMHQRVSGIWIGNSGQDELPSSNPLMISPEGDANNSDWWLADCYGVFFRRKVLRRYKIREGQPPELITYPAVGTPVQIVLPVDVEAVGNPQD